ncbi:UDP-N-acetyl-D-mannosamine dehydrogenase / UDP-glucose 6-dehydrogenase [Paramecium bursaria Chlorella virus Can18-4]|nr:UDP-N-acetyl-D-mannosamine dehydrogenase / UDP-glucose 6-dehydrogenase [Paramecium bursaria Chlorella virus Can18-4]
MAKNITVVGSGYVGSAMAALLSKEHNVTVLDISQERVDSLNNRKSPIEDKDIDEFLSDPNISIKATTQKSIAYADPEFVIIATPTDYDTKSGYFNTRSVDSVILDAKNMCPNAYIIIKSTIPIGFVDSIRTKYSISNIAFSPEFLREGRALYDNLYPSRIIVGDNAPRAIEFAEMLASASRIPDVPKIYMGSREAESVKLFANTYLAMRVSYFNELDTFALKHDLDASKIVEGVMLEPRIGSGYCNPSFGYGGYCFPKDTKQLHANFAGIPQSLIGAIVESNIVRKQAIIDDIASKNLKTIGIYRLAMKAGSDNCRDAAILDIMSQLRARGFVIKIHDKSFSSYQDYDIENNLEKFINECDIIVANRAPEEIRALFGSKLFTRDIFFTD